jgi:hypothetical protein
MEHAARPEIVVILVDLSEGIANLQVILIVVHPMLLAAVHGKPAIRTLKIDVSRWHRSFLSTCILGLRYNSWKLCGLVIGMRAVCMLPHESGTAAELGHW